MFQQDKFKEKRISELEFVQGADNFYRTKRYIVKQHISICVSQDAISMLMSEDTYYLRTDKRDKEYETLCGFRGKKIDGKRIRSATYTRRYID